jgi:hypothetical protein
VLLQKSHQKRMKHTFKIRPKSHGGSLARWYHFTTHTQNGADSDIKLSDSELIVIIDVFLISRTVIMFIHDALYRDALVKMTALILEFQLVTCCAPFITGKVLDLLS